MESFTGKGSGKCNNHCVLKGSKSTEIKGIPVCVGRDSSVSTATRYGLDGPGIESRWRRDFPHLSITALRPTQPPIQWVPGLSRGKAAGA